MRYRFLRFPDGKAKAVTLSYDDGYKDDLHFSDTISKYGMKCTFNLNCPGIQRYNLSDEEVRKYIIDRGHEIAVHGAVHRANGVLKPIQGIRDVLDCRMYLEKRFNMIIRGMAYPDSGIKYFTNGTAYDDVKTYLSALDISYARSYAKDEDKSFLLPTDWHNWETTIHHRDPEIMEYVETFANLDWSNEPFGSRNCPKLFFMWGHTCEFTTDNNWETLYSICEKLGNRDDIWYATNIEIYDYVNAYNSLIFSTDESIVFNPTIYDVWFIGDGKIYKVCAGQTLELNNQANF